MAAADGTPLLRIRLIPAGTFTLKDGRGPYRVNPEAVAGAIRKYWGAEDMPLDYDHQTLATQTKGGAGGTAPASGWVKPGNITAEADGVYANDIEWTAEAAAAISGKKYKYFSPLMGLTKSGDVTNLYGGGLTNDPAIGGLTAVAASSFHPQEEPTMSLSARLAALLSLAATATEDEVFTAASARFGQLTSLRTALGAKDNDSHETVVAAASGKAVDPKKVAGADDVIVPASVMTEIQQRLGDLEVDRAAASVKRGVEAGKIAPASEASMLKWARRDLAGFEEYLATAPEIVAAGAQLGGQAPTTGEHGLTAEELQAASALGMSPEEYSGKAVTK